MKKYGRYGVRLGLFLCLFVMSCSDDNLPVDEPENEPELTINEWIEGIMRSDYLWCTEIPAADKLNTSATPEEFFYSMLSLKDGKTIDGKHQYYYSYMEKNKNYKKTRTSINVDDTYGAEFNLFNMVDESGIYLDFYYARVLYILPNSPAAKAGLERGDWIIGINGNNNITSANYEKLLRGNTTQWSVKRGDAAIMPFKIEASRAVEDNPLYYHSVLSFGDKKIGYLVYNHFTPGLDSYLDRTYDTEMKKIFADFQSNGVNEFVLDLRYNGGGFEMSANMLAGLLVPEESKNKVYCVFSDNKGQQSSNRFDRETGGTAGYLKLNANRIYILTSINTASSSEVVINSLKPFMNVTLIGELTEGKNVGMNRYSDDKYEWTYWPITLRVTNAEGFDYSGGFEPDIEWNEFDLTQNQADALLPLGDPNEFMLSKAIALITGVDRSARGRVVSAQPILRGESIYQSTNRHSPGGVLVVGEEEK